MRRLALVLLVGACSGNGAAHDEPASASSEEVASCSADADCRVFGSGLCGCRCMALGATSPDPACDQATDRAAGCAAEPCAGMRAVCDPTSHQCTAQRIEEARATCESDVDCDTCWGGTGCSCRSVAAGTECGPTPGHCAAVPCRAESASCWNRRCVLRHAVAGPCSTDAECEVRGDDCECDLYPALASAPAVTACQGRGCGGRPAPSQWQARCDIEASRCVLERRP